MKSNGQCWKILIAGSGGQGIVTLGKVLAQAGMARRLNVSYLPSYGAEMRGGYVYSMLSFTQAELLSPVISLADYGIFMNEFSLQMLRDKLRNSAWCLWNSSLAGPPRDERIIDIGIPASEIAEKNGDVRAANMVMLGALQRILEDGKFPVRDSDLLEGIKDMLPDRQGQELNWKAVIDGRNLIERILRNG